METSFPHFEKSSDLGRTEIAPEVIEAITGMAANEVDGVASMSHTFVSGLAEKLGRKKLNQGVKVEIGEHHTVIDVSIVVVYGARIPQVASALQQHIKSVVEDLTGLRVLEINVHIVGATLNLETKVDNKS